MNVLVIAPHADDETLGCGGSLLRHIAQGDKVHWMIVTSAHPEHGFAKDWIEIRAKEIQHVAKVYGFSGVHQAELPATLLDTLPKAHIIKAVSAVVTAVQPHTLYLPYRNDAHSDHAAVFDAASACTKTFRYPSVKRVLSYETLSETEFGIRPDDSGFKPNVFVDVSAFSEKKIEIMNSYTSEMGDFPFPRSTKTLQAQLTLRGSHIGVSAAEAFILLKEIL